MEGVNKSEDGVVCTSIVEANGILPEKTEKETKEDGGCTESSCAPPAEECKTELPTVDVFKVATINNSTEDEKKNEEVNESKNECNDVTENACKMNEDLNDCITKEVWLPVSERREIFSGVNEKYSNIYKLPEFRCCVIEHNYCKFRRSGVKPLRAKNQLRKRTCLDVQSENTPTFENRSELDNRIEQPTVVVRDSITKHVDSDSNSSSNGSIKDRLRKRTVSKSNSSLCRAADVTNTYGKDRAVKFLTPKIRIRRSSKGRGEDYYDIIVEDGTSLPSSFLASKSESNERNTLTARLERRNSGSKIRHQVDSNNRAINSNEVAEEISDMEKIAQSKSEFPSNSTEKSTESVGSANNDTVHSNLRKPSGNENASEPQKEGEYVLSMQNLSKKTPEDKNWNLEYTEDDVKNLGLDDLLLRASELNAENFTKALGQNSSGRNGTKGDSPDIVLSFPASKRESDDPLDGDNSKGGNIKKAKLEFFKKCVKDDKAGKPANEEASKKAPEVPKRTGIKVKTVQNINEEFKDSLGAKLKKLEVRDIAPESSAPLFAVNGDLQKSNKPKEVFVSDARDQAPDAKSNLLCCRKVNKQQDQNKNIEELPDDARPFIMTIIQNKDNPVKDHMPTVLAPKVFVKPKPVFTESGPFLQKIDERSCDITCTKIGEGAESSSSKPGDNVTLVVSDARTFEVVNADEFNSEGGIKKIGVNSHYVVNYGSITKKEGDGKNVVHASVETGSRKKNIPVVLNSKKKYLRMPWTNSQKLVVATAEDLQKRIKSCPRPPNRVVNYSEGVASIQGEKVSGEKTTFTVTSIEQKIIPKDAVAGGGRFVKVIPNNMYPRAIPIAESCTRNEEQSNSDAETDHVSQSKEQMMTLTAFSNILKDILPDKWILSLDKKFGLQIIKIHLDELLNPSIMISVVVGRTGKVTVNVRGRQLEKSHDLFANLCDVGTSNEKISINYILAIINKLRFFNVCFGCDDLSLKKYWCEDGFIEYYTEFQQTYRSHICESLVRLGKKRCYPCYRMHESLKKRKRREQLLKKTEMDSAGKSAETMGNGNDAVSHNHQVKGVKRNLEEFLEESFINMKQRITDEIEKTREDEENEKVPKTQDEVLSFMGLTRKDSLDINLRKSKREKKGFRKCESLITNNVNKEELYFLEKYWPDINVLFSTSLLIGAYSRTSTGRLREKCRMFYKLLSTWRGIVRDNPDWIGGYINLAENLVNDDELVNSESVKEKFDKMDVPALRAYIINCVKEVNKIKSRLRTKNNYFKVLYNTFVKPRMKKAKQATDLMDSPCGKLDLETGNDLTKEESTPEKLEDSKLSTSTELESSDENSRHSCGAAPCISDGD